MMALKMSTGKTTNPRVGYKSKNGSAWIQDYVSRSDVALIPAGDIQIGTGYAGTCYNGGIGTVLCYNKMLSDSEILQVYNATKRYYTPFDTDAQAFITAAGITDSTQQNAIDKLVLDLKSYSLWSKMQALYPFVGGTASSHKYNLKDPRDLDVAYRIQFNGGWVHNSNGIQGDGSTGYADTFAATNTVAIPNRANHWSSYNRELPSSAKYTGTFDYPPNFTSFGWYGGISNANWFGGLQNFEQTGVPCQTGFINGTVRSSSNSELYRNGSSIYTTGGATSFVNNYNYYLGAYNLQGPGSYNDAQVAFVSLGNSLTASDAANLYTAVQAFQTTLGRQV
jgi:hypothetical protein